MAAFAPERTAEQVRRAGLPVDPLLLDIAIVVAPALQSTRGLARHLLHPYLGAGEFRAGPRQRLHQSRDELN